MLKEYLAMEKTRSRTKPRPRSRRTKAGLTGSGAASSSEGLGTGSLGASEVSGAFYVSVMKILLLATWQGMPGMKLANNLRALVLGQILLFLRKLMGRIPHPANIG